jgi:hypothetical protein
VGTYGLAYHMCLTRQCQSTFNTFRFATLELAIVSGDLINDTIDSQDNGQAGLTNGANIPNDVTAIGQAVMALVPTASQFGSCLFNSLWSLW